MPIRCPGCTLALSQAGGSSSSCPAPPETPTLTLKTHAAHATGRCGCSHPAPRNPDVQRQLHSSASGSGPQPGGIKENVSPRSLMSLGKTIRNPPGALRAASRPAQGEIVATLEHKIIPFKAKT